MQYENELARRLPAHGSLVEVVRARTSVHGVHCRYGFQGESMPKAVLLNVTHFWEIVDDDLNASLMQPFWRRFCSLFDSVASPVATNNEELILPCNSDQWWQP